jgi:hypothetical protein
MDALAAAHHAAVHMIDTSIVRVHQHGACTARNKRQSEKQSERGAQLQPVPLPARNLVERFFNKNKHRRRLATRYDKLAANYFAFTKLASIGLWPRIDESTT